MAKRTSLSGKLEGHSLYVTSRADPLLPFVSEFHRKYIVPTFDARESEAVELWIDRLNDQVAEGPLEASSETTAVVTSTAAMEGVKPHDGERSHHEMVAHRDAATAATTGSPTVATLSCSPVDYEFIVAVIVRDVDNEVLGGASHEIYLQAQCALISFLVVDPALRGLGAAGALISCVQTNATVLLQQVYAPTPASLRALFIEVLQVRDDHSSDDEDEQPEKEDKDKEDAGTGREKKDSAHSRHTEDHHVKHLHHLHAASGKKHGPHRDMAPPSSVAGSALPKQTSEASTASVVGPRFRSAQRQVIFRRLGFTALDYDLLHPGSMRGHRYNLGVLRTQCVSSSGKEEEEGDGTGRVASGSGAASRRSGSEENLRFPVPVLLAFLEGLILGILRDEGATDLSQWEEDYVRFLTGKEWVGAGDQFWC